MGYLISKCTYDGEGVKQKNDGLYLSVYLPHKNEAGLCIYDDSKELIETIIFDSALSTGNYFVLFIKGLNINNLYYRFISDGEIIIDKYSKIIIGNETFGKEICDSDLYCSLLKSKTVTDWNKDKCVEIPYNNTILYSCHVRGITKNDLTVKNKNIRGTFKALENKIEYFRDLGITSLVLLPIVERIEKKTVSGTEISNDFKKDNKVTTLNYWGFGDAYNFAIKKSYCYSEDSVYEFKHFIKKLHDNNMECILSFDLFGKTESEVSYILKYWITEYHIDGFRLFVSKDIGAYIIKDSFYDNTKLIFNEFFDVPDNKNKKYKNIAFINSDFMLTARRFIKSDEDIVSMMSYLTKANNNKYALINTISDFNGFTLNDLVSYDRKHNEINLENNEDGTDYNYSWNCGFEGETDKKSVIKLRTKQCVNLMMLLFLSQGTPMLTGGDEWLNSNNGNNNPYCQDNNIGWINYDKNARNKAFYSFVKSIITFRLNYSILHQPFELKAVDYISCKLPDISFHGKEAYCFDNNPASREFAVLYCGDYAKQYIKHKENSIYILFNMHWDEKEFSLPVQDKKHKYSLVCSSDDNLKDLFTYEKTISDKASLTVKGRSITVLSISEI